MAGRRSGAPSGPARGSAADDQPDADPVEVAKTIITRQLAVGPRTRAQLAAKLRARGVPEEAAATALDRFSELGYVDDVAFADAWVSSRRSGKGLARRALEHELVGKGVDVETARAALAQVDPDEERQTALRLVRRKLPSLASQPPETQTRRLVSMLARKGYSGGLAYAVVRQALASDEELLDDSG